MGCCYVQSSSPRTWGQGAIIVYDCQVENEGIGCSSCTPYFMACLEAFDQYRKYGIKQQTTYSVRHSIVCLYSLPRRSAPDTHCQLCLVIWQSWKLYWQVYQKLPCVYSRLWDKTTLQHIHAHCIHMCRITKHPNQATITINKYGTHEQGAVSLAFITRHPVEHMSSKVWTSLHISHILM